MKILVLYPKVSIDIFRVSVISRGYQKWSWLEKYTYFCFWKRKGHLKYPSNKILNKVSPQIFFFFFTVQDKMYVYTQLMQSVIFKVESQFHHYRRTKAVTPLQTAGCTHVWLFRQAKRAEPYNDTQTTHRKGRENADAQEQRKSLITRTSRGTVTNRNRHELFSSMQ